MSLLAFYILCSKNQSLQLRWSSSVREHLHTISGNNSHSFCMLRISLLKKRQIFQQIHNSLEEEFVRAVAYIHRVLLEFLQFLFDIQIRKNGLYNRGRQMLQILKGLSLWRNPELISVTDTVSPCVLESKSFYSKYF